MLKYLYIAILSLFIMGCAQKEKIVTEKEYVTVTIHKEHFQKPMLPEPPARKEYMDATDRQRTGLLKIYIQQLQGHIEQLYTMLDSIELTMQETKNAIDKGVDK